MKTSTTLGIVVGAVVVGVGAFALTRKPSAEPTPSKPGILPGPPVPSPSSKLVFVTNNTAVPPTVSFKKDQYYRGRMALKFSGLSPFNASAEEDSILKGLVALGFKEVRVYMKISDLPSDWPSETTLGSTSETRWFQGQWSGQTETMVNPLAFEMVWVTRSPALVLAQAAKAAGTSSTGHHLQEVGCG
jgi:hypothetical protein